MTNLFISYRREDAAGHAGRLSDRLIARFGADRVFIDVDDIEPGQDFEQAIEQTLGRCDHLLAVVGPRWLSSLKERADDPNDLVQREICTALARGITVIPVLVGGGRMPAVSDLPSVLRAFARCDAIEIDDESFDADARRLLDHLARQSPVPERRFASLGWRQAAIAAVGIVILALIGARTLGPGGDGATQSAATLHLPAFTYGSWTLRNSRDEEGRAWNNSVLQFTEQDASRDGLLLRGRFTWRHNNVLVGTEEFSGRYVERTRQVILEGTRVTDAAHPGPEHLAIGSYSAVLDQDERALVRGRWGVTAQGQPGYVGEWEAVR